MKNLSKWAKSNPIEARWIIALAKTLVYIKSIILGIWIYVEGIHIPDYLLNISVGAFLLVCFFYPIKKHTKGIFKQSYGKQKMMDGILVLLCPIFIIIGINQLMYSPNNSKVSTSPEALFMVNKLNEKPKLYDTRKSVKQNFKELKKQVKSELKAFKKEYKLKPGAVSEVIFLIFLLIGLIGLASVLAALTCTLSCNGQEGLAAVVLIGGAGLLVWLGIFVGKKILKRNDVVVPEG